MTHKTTLITSLVVALALVVAMAFVATAGGPHNKATGDVTWTARTHLPPADQLPGLVSKFNVHDEAPGMQSDRGTHELFRPADSEFPGGSLTVDVSCVNVASGEAWFAGTVTEADGGYSGLVDDVFLYWVSDGGSPGEGGDMIGGRGYGSIEQACIVVDDGSWQGTGEVTDGNLMTHYWE